MVIIVGIELNILIAFGNMAILTMLILLIQEHEISFYLFESSLISLLVFFIGLSI